MNSSKKFSDIENCFRQLFIIEVKKEMCFNLFGKNSLQEYSDYIDKRNKKYQECKNKFME